VFQPADCHLFSAVLHIIVTASPYEPLKEGIDLPSFQSGIGAMRANGEALERGLEDYTEEE